MLELEKGEVPLEKSLTLFEEGMQLSATCRKQLEEAEGKVEILLKQNGKLQAEPFEPPTEKVLRKITLFALGDVNAFGSVRCRSQRQPRTPR